MLLERINVKFVSVAMANRIKIYLPKLVNDDQTGFIKGRCISENIRLIDSVIKYTASKTSQVYCSALILKKHLIPLSGLLSRLKHFFLSISVPLLFSGSRPFIVVRKAV